jgi:hypothetical protein
MTIRLALMPTRNYILVECVFWGGGHRADTRLGHGSKLLRAGLYLYLFMVCSYGQLTQVM